MQKHRLGGDVGPRAASWYLARGDKQYKMEMTDAEDGGRMTKPKPSLKARLYEEVKRFLMIFAYLWLVFVVFLVHEWIVLADNHSVSNSTALRQLMLWFFPRSCSSRRSWGSPRGSKTGRRLSQLFTNPSCSHHCWSPLISSRKSSLACFMVEVSPRACPRSAEGVWSARSASRQFCA